MPMRLKKEWMVSVQMEMDAYLSNNPPEKPFVHTTRFNKAAQWLIYELDKRGLKYRVYNLGAGVKKITTETDRCPACKRRF